MFDCYVSLSCSKVKKKIILPARFGAALTGDLLGGDNLADSINHLGSVLLLSIGNAISFPPGGLTIFSSFCKYFSTLFNYQFTYTCIYKQHYNSYFRDFMTFSYSIKKPFNDNCFIRVQQKMCLKFLIQTGNSYIYCPHVKLFFCYPDKKVPFL